MTRRGPFSYVGRAVRPQGTNRRSAALGAGALVVSLTTFGCGGASALLHPAHPMPSDGFSAGAGVSRQFASNRVERDIDRARAGAERPLTSPDEVEAHLRGVLSEAFVAPGVAPWVAARLGLGGAREAGITYTGRSVRVDVRQAFVREDLALSIGLGASGVLSSPDSRPIDSAPANDVDLDARGFGVDVPILVGVRLGSGLFELWAGPRVGFESIWGDLGLLASDGGSVARTQVTGRRWWGTLLAGLSVGVPPVDFRFEMAVGYHALSGELEPDEEGRLPAVDEMEGHAWTYAPTAAIVGKF